MKNDQLIHVSEELKKNQILISFSGKFSQTLIEELGEAVKKYLETEDIPKKEIYNVFSIFIEQTQNIRNYSSEKTNSFYYEQILHSGIVIIGREEKGYYICSGNITEGTDIQPLITIIEEIAALNKEELKKRYKEKLKEVLAPESKSAGLGLIDVARKANYPIEYSVKEVDENLYFFSLKAIV
ncbi:SiaB family protein kinase [Brevibacillus sp. NRS-1366]|uniref:SiaB family protein kinase n=1 Tax=Brevibacillus sp. NRS-1366 TaxID=3233899 RepID=UPI003D2593DE